MTIRRRLEGKENGKERGAGAGAEEKKKRLCIRISESVEFPLASNSPSPSIFPSSFSLSLHISSFISQTLLTSSTILYIRNYHIRIRHSGC